MADKKKLLLGPLALCSLALAGCSVDLGVLDKSDNLESYYKAFGKVKGLYDGGDHSYDVEDSLFNAKTINEYAWEKPEYEVKQEQYVYVIIPFKEKLTIESIALVVKSNINVTMKINCFYFQDDDSVPEKIKYLTSPDTDPEDEDKPIEYDDELLGKSLLTGEKDLVADVWDNFGLGNFKPNDPVFEDGYLHVKKDSYFYLRFENNSGWNRDTLTPFAFTFLDLIVRAVE